MKGIREAAMGSPDEEPTRYTPPSTSWPSSYPKSAGQGNLLGDLDDDYYAYPKYVEPYKIKSKSLSTSKDIVVTITIPYSEIGDTADYESRSYNSTMAETHAMEIAYDRLEELAGKNYESRYGLDFNVTDDAFEYIVTVTLTPTK